MSLPNPKGLQREVLALPSVGHFVVLGTAGSGKTLLAILRASYLSKAETQNGEKTLLVTFNKSLITYLTSLADAELDKVDVINYHKFARGYLHHRRLISRNCIASSTLKLSFIVEAIENVKKEVGENSTLNRAPEVFNEEIDWIQKMGINSLEDYIKVQRVGRLGTRITKENRIYFFKVYLKYIELREKSGYTYDWIDISSKVRDEFIKDSELRMYKHIIIDEGQDFSPTMLQSLVNAIPSDGSLTFFGDVAQQIYGSRVSWRTAGIRPPKIWYFEENYRNTQEIAALGLSISKMPFFNDDVDLVEPRTPKASGPLPTLVKYKNEEEELNSIVSNSISLGKTQMVAILVRDREAVRTIVEKFSEKGVSVQELHGYMSSWNSKPGISVGTYHSAKGLEFDSVLLPYCDKSRLPRMDRIIALESVEEAMSEEVKLIYVAVTRAKVRLLIAYSEELTALFPDRDELYRRLEL